VSILRTTFARLCRDTRTTLDVTQRELAAAVGVSRAHVAAIESGRANPSLDLVTRIAEALGLELDFRVRAPIVFGRSRQRDLVHARCSGHIDRRLRRGGWSTQREVEIVHGRSHGWIDLVAYDPRTRTMLIVEIKTRLDDIGLLERQVAWYERTGPAIASRLGWRPVRILTWVLVLASDEAESVMQTDREVLALSFPGRAPVMQSIVEGVVPEGGDAAGRGQRAIALIDPASRRRRWLMKSRSDGRRSAAPYRDYADAAARLGDGPGPSGPSA
jgi:transcriptional regulator with XRE-family HTH domain